MRLLLVILWLSGLPGVAIAGPWPRTKGETYVFVGHFAGDEAWTSLYAEYGGPLALTFGLEVGGHLFDRAGAKADGRLRSFVRLPIFKGREGLTPWLFAMEFGAGADIEESGDIAPRLDVGLSAGRPFSTRFGDGWISLDVKASIGVDAKTRFNLSGVVGVKPTARLSVEAGLFAEFDDNASITFAPVVQYDLNRAGSMRLGLAIKNEGGSALTLGWARTF